MFELIKNKENIREGKIKINNKIINTPCFFMTSDFGGGGTNVSRLLVYSDLFIETNSQLLLNYYYLDINSDLTPRFDTNMVKQISNFKDVIAFIQYVKETYFNSGKVINNFSYDKSKSWNPILLLDSGSGNILRGKIKRKEITHENYKLEYKKLIKDYIDFSNLNKFDIIIAMDFAGKNTLKKGEMKDKDYVSGVIEFSSNEKNLELLRLTLDYLKQNKLDTKVLAPIHGNSPQEYKNYIESILKLEKKEGYKFSGFALGSLGNPNKINKELWEIHEDTNLKVKAGLYLTKIGSIIRNVLKENKDNRPIHVLGSASPYNLIPLVFAGCDTFDCHSAWRRASDGNELSKCHVFDKDFDKENEDEKVSFSKVLVPLLNPKLEIIKENSKKYLEFVNINKYDFKCNCKVCQNIKLDDLKKLYSGNKEENYYAKILIYLHNVLQYDYLCEKMREIIDKDSLKKFIESIPESNYKKNMKEILFPIKAKNIMEYF